MSGAGPGARPVTEVAVGVMLREDGAVLLADRPAGKPYAGYWEFPGGKIEAGESVHAALARELSEELGVAIGPSEPWVVMEHDYPHAYVRLHFRRIRAWQGTPHPVEGQQLRFHVPGAEAPQPLLPAALPAMRWVQLPAACLASPGTAHTPAQATDWFEEALGRGARLILWHEPGLAADERAQALSRCAALARGYGARLLADARSGAATDAGAFLDLAALRAAGQRPAVDWLAAAVRDASDLQRAVRLRCDCAVIDADPAGAAPDWEALCRDAPLPLYVPQALSPARLAAARGAGAQGVLVAALPGGIG